MKSLKILLYICLFFAIGEAIVRIDKEYSPLDNSPKKIEIKIEETSLVNEVNKGLFIPDSNQIRILVLGDSYIYGAGIAPSEKFSNKLSKQLKETNSSGKNILVLDVSRASNNTLDNYTSFLYYEKRFDPHFIFWAYNIDDMLGSIDLNNKQSNEISDPPAQSTKKRSGLQGIIKKVYSFSELAKFIATGLQKELIAKGIIPPGGDLEYLIKKAYSEENKNWQNTRSLLNNVTEICKSNNSKFILYKMPTFNLLKYPYLFSLIDKAMMDYYRSNNYISYINGIQDFNNDDENKYKISKYDGHPNELAHLKISKRIADLIIQEYSTINNLD